MSNIRWGDIKNTIISIFDNKTNIENMRYHFFCRFDNDNLITLISDTNPRTYFAHIGMEKNSIYILLLEYIKDITIPLELDEVEFTLSNGRPDEHFKIFYKILTDILSQVEKGHQ